MDELRWLLFELFFTIFPALDREKMETDFQSFPLFLFPFLWRSFVKPGCRLGSMRPPPSPPATQHRRPTGGFLSKAPGIPDPDGKGLGDRTRRDTNAWSPAQVAAAERMRSAAKRASPSASIPGVALCCSPVALPRAAAPSIVSPGRPAVC